MPLSSPLSTLGAMSDTTKSKLMCLTPVVKDVLSQQDFLGTRGKWVLKIQEYNLEIKPTKIIKGQGLAKMLTESNEESIQMGRVTN
jgi:hypothetical protein